MCSHFFAFGLILLHLLVIHGVQGHRVDPRAARLRAVGVDVVVGAVLLHLDAGDGVDEDVVHRAGQDVGSPQEESLGLESVSATMLDFDLI